MKILIITNKLPYPPKDGGAIATFYLADSLAHYADKVDILAINTNKHYFDISKIPQKVTEKIKFYDVYKNTDIKFGGLLKNLFFSKLPYNAERFIFDEFKQKIVEILQTNSYDIIQFEGLYVLPYLDIVKSKSSALAVYRAHNVEHEIWERTLKQTHNLIKKYYLKILTKRLKKFEQNHINKYDLLVPITERDDKKLSELGNTKPQIVIPTGITAEKYNIINNIVCQENTIFHIGALDWSPNQEGLLWFLDNCWDKILQKKPDVKFFIAGRNAPQWLIDKFKKKNVEYIGEVDDAQKFILSKQIMIVPLLSGSGMRIKIIEGMALGKTIVTTTIGVEGINAENEKEIIIADSAEKFIDNIIYLFENQMFIDNLGENAKRFIRKNFDNNVIAKKLFEFYEQNIKN